MIEPRVTVRVLYDEMRRMLVSHNLRHTRNLKIRDWLWIDKANVVVVVA